MTDRKAAALLIALVAVAYADILLLGRGLYQADLTSYHYPMKKVVRDAVARGEIPYWNPLASSGQPLAANPAYELWYPPQWLVFLPSFHFGFQLHVIVHFLIAAIGMYVLIRSFDASIPAALFGALAFVFCGPYLSLSSKLPLLFAFSWMPLALYFVRMLLDEWRWSYFAGAALTLGMQLLIVEPTLVLQTWTLIGIQALVPLPRAGEGGRRPGEGLLRIALVGVAALLVAAAQFVPALDFARDTVRTQPFPFAIVSNWSMPLYRPVEMFFPSLFSHIAGDNGRAAVETMYPYRIEPYITELYIGIIVAILALAGVLRSQRGALAFAALFIGAVILAAGEHTPLLRMLYDLNIGRTLRYPEKYALTAAFVAIVWASLMFDRLRGDPKLARTAMILAAIVASIALIATISSANDVLQTRTYFALQLARGVLAFMLLGPLRTRLRAPVWASFVTALTTADLIASMRRTTDRMPREYFEPPALLASLSQDSRVFHEAAWDNWMPKPEAIPWISNRTIPEYWRLLRNGLFPNLPQMYGRAMALEDDIDRTSLQNMDTLRELLKRLRNEGNIGREVQLLRMSGVTRRIRYVPFDPKATIPVLVEALDGYPRYAFADAMQRADFESALDRGAGVLAVADIPSFEPAPGRVTSVQESDNFVRLAARTEGRALLLITVTAHKYWRATIDGKAAPLIPANIAYQALEVPPGDHTIELRYRNPLVIPSAIVSLIAILGLVITAPLIRLRHLLPSRRGEGRGGEIRAGSVR